MTTTGVAGDRLVAEVAQVGLIYVPVVQSMMDFRELRPTIRYLVPAFDHQTVNHRWAVFGTRQ